MKKTIIWISVILIVVICIQLGILLKVNNNHIWKHSANFKEYADDFTMVKDYVEEQFGDEDYKRLSVSINEKKEIRLYDAGTNEYLQLPTDILSSLELIRKHGFPDKDSNFDTLKIQGDRISFCIENGQYALVFSPNGRPSWVNTPTEDSAVRVRSIGDGWYHVRKKSA